MSDEATRIKWENMMRDCVLSSTSRTMRQTREKDEIAGSQFERCRKSSKMATDQREFKMGARASFIATSLPFNCQGNTNTRLPVFMPLPEKSGYKVST